MEYMYINDDSRIYLGIDNDSVGIYWSDHREDCKRMGHLIFKISNKNLGFLEEFIYDKDKESRLAVSYYDKEIKKYILKILNVNLETGDVRQLPGLYSDINIPIVRLDKGIYYLVDINGLKTIVSGYDYNLSWRYNNNYLMKPQKFSKNYEGIDLKIVDFSISKFEESDLFKICFDLGIDKYIYGVLKIPNREGDYFKLSAYVWSEIDLKRHTLWDINEKGEYLSYNEFMEELENSDFIKEVAIYKSYMKNLNEEQRMNINREIKKYVKKKRV